MKESQFQKEVIKFLKTRDENIYIMNDIATYYAGRPDISLVIQGKFLAIELKVGKYKPTALQIKTLNNIKQAEGLATVFWHSDNWQEELDMLLASTLNYTLDGFYAMYPLPKLPKGTTYDK